MMVLCLALQLTPTVVAGQDSITCVVPRAQGENWTTFAASAFSLRVPPGFERTRNRGIDSEGAAWERAGARFDFDFGMYSNPLTELTQVSEIHRCSATINGTPATVVTGRRADGQFVAAAHWPDDSASGTLGRTLTIYGTATDSSSHAQLLAMLWSVRFSARDP
jgi:hypothetical protein